MKLKLALFALLATAMVGTSSCAKSDAQDKSANTTAANTTLDAANSPALAEEDSAMDDFDPFDPNIEEKLNLMDEEYEAETGLSSHLPDKSRYFAAGCKRSACAVYAHVSKAQQLLSLYENGNLIGQFATSSGAKGHGTPNFDQRPNGRIYDAYTSKAYPGGDYNGLGNMPYAVFISGGFAIHGTGKSNWPKLGRPASHGCIRVHPDNAYRFNRLVRQYGVANTWITVE